MGSDSTGHSRGHQGALEQLRGNQSRDGFRSLSSDFIARQRHYIDPLAELDLGDTGPYVPNGDLTSRDLAFPHATDPLVITAGDDLGAASPACAMPASPDASYHLAIASHSRDLLHLSSAHSGVPWRNLDLS